MSQDKNSDAYKSPESDNPTVDKKVTQDRSVITKSIYVLSLLFFVFSLLGLVGLWLGMLWAFSNAEAIGDRTPMLTPGVIELISYVLGFVTLFWLAVVLIWRFSGKWKWIALPLAPVLLAACFWILGNYFRVVFDADMNPIRVEALNRSYKLEPKSRSTDPVKSTLVAGPTDYPRFLGANEDQTASWLTWPEKKSELAFKTLWRQPIGFGWSGFIAVGDVAFTMEQQGPWECVSAYTIENGELLWVHRDRHRHDEPAGGIGPRSTPTFHKGRLYTLGSLGTLNCLDAASGRLIWQKELTQVFDIPVQVFNEGTDQQYDVEETNLLWGRAASPLIVEDLVVVPIGGVKESDSGAANLRSLAAFSIEDGSIVWEGGKHQLSYGSPTLGVVAGKQQILITNEATVAGHDPKTGEQLWQFNRPGDSGGGANTSQPMVVAENKVLLSKEYGLGGELIEVTENAGQWQVESIWDNPRVLRTKLTVPVVHGDYAYCISGGILECTHVPTGERQWRGARVQHGQLILIDGRLLVMSEKGTLLLVECTPDDFIVHYQQDGFLDGRCWNMLCVSDDLLLARSELEATCIQLPAKTRKTTTQSTEPKK